MNHSHPRFRLPRIYSIEGNIGSGKTTLFQQLRVQNIENDKIQFVEEPVDIWQNLKSREDGENILVKFYKNQEKYSFAFQIMVYHTFLKEIQKCIEQNPTCEIILCERSIDSGRRIFSQMAREYNYIDDIQWQIYEMVMQDCPYSLSGVIYLDVPPEVCHQRIAVRARKGEETIPLEYLQNCHARHEKWLVEMEVAVAGKQQQQQQQPPPVLHLKNDDIVLHDLQLYRQIYEFLGEGCM